MKELTVKISKSINASIEQVFDAWLDPEKLAQFMMPMPGMLPAEVSNEPRTGGQFKIIMKVGDDELPHTGEYLEISRPHLLIFSWHSHHSVEGSEVKLELTSLPSGSTQLVLTHIKFANEEARTNHEGGWTHIIEMLNNEF